MTNTTIGRYFIAVNVSEEIKDEAAKLQKKLYESNRSLKVSYVKPDNFHITLKFLGDLDFEQLEIVKSTVSKVSSEYEGFTVETGGIGFFPKKENARVIFWEMLDKNILSKIAGDIDFHLSQNGFQREKKKFSPHLTLGRIKEPRRGEIITTDTPCLNTAINDIKIVQSFLSPQGATYKIINSYGLK